MIILLLPLFFAFSVNSSHLSPNHQIKATSQPVTADKKTLKYVQVVWRHGDRTPSAVLSPSDADKWPEGLGELTKKGVAQQYRLGKWLRKRYGDWLGKGFDRKEVYIRSSDYNRTLMSAQANMAGLFPPEKSEIWEDALPWQPVPVHSVPKYMDKQLYEDIDCPKAQAEQDKVWNSPQVRHVEKEYSSLLKLIAKHTNQTELRLSDLWSIFDPFNCQYHHNVTNPLPAWVTEKVFNDIVRLYDISSQFKFHTEVLRRLRGGPLLEEIYNKFIAKENGLMGDGPKLFAYSAHDTTLVALLATLGIFPAVFPLYATMVLMELHEIGGQHVVQLYHKNVTDSDEIFRYEIPGCLEPCTLQKLHNDMNKYLPTDWERECGLTAEDVDVSSYIVAICVLSFTTVLFGGIIALDVLLKRRIRNPTGRIPLIPDDEDVTA